MFGRGLGEGQLLVNGGEQRLNRLGPIWWNAHLGTVWHGATTQAILSYHSMMSAPAHHSMRVLERPLVRGAVAAALLAVGAATFLFLQTRDDESPPADVAAYNAPVYSVCDDGDASGADQADGPPVVGVTAPGFRLCNGEESTSLAGFQGDVVWVNFWATWCVPCKKELPDIQRIYDEKRFDGLVVLLVNVGEDEADATAFLTRLGIAMPVVLDRDSRIYDGYRLQGLPDSFFIARDGTLATFHYGELNEKKGRERLADAGLD